MSDINWKDGAVCYAGGKQWNPSYNKGLLIDSFGAHLPFESLFYNDLKLNEIKVGDFIPASELDTEKKYNEVVEVLGLFGFDGFEKSAKRALRPANKVFMADSGDTFVGCAVDDEDLTRKLTYQQIIAIGKLKRMMLDKVEAKLIEKSNRSESPKTSIDYLNECMEVQKQRGQQYNAIGTGERSFSACADAYNAITGGNLKGSDICLILQILKDVRQYSNPTRLHEDSLLDKVSYSSLHAEELNKELK